MSPSAFLVFWNYAEIIFRVQWLIKNARSGISETILLQQPAAHTNNRSRILTPYSPLFERARLFTSDPSVVAVSQSEGNATGR